MNLSDKSRATTVEDLIRRYNLDSLSDNAKVIKTLDNTLTKTYGSIKKYITQMVNLGSTTQYFMSGVPTLTNEPAKEWDTYAYHVSDLYYDKDTGKTYIFAVEGDTYSWEELDNEALQELMSLASQDADTLTDSKRNVYTSKPSVPYNVGDIWINGSNILRCRVGETEEFNQDDWLNYQYYTSDMGLSNAVNILNDFKATVITNYVTNTELVKETGKITLRVDTVEKYAQDAQDTADEAQSTANTAQSTANTAQTSANNAQNSADTAQSTAETAQTSANNAQSTANTAQATAEAKAKVFTSTPTPPYNVGDVWVKEGYDSDLEMNTYFLYVCQNAKATGETYEESDFSLQPTYASTSQLKVEQNRISGIIKERNTIEYTTTKTKENTTGYIEDALEEDLVTNVLYGNSEQDETPTPDSPIEVETVNGITNLFDINRTITTFSGSGTVLNDNNCYQNMNHSTGNQAGPGTVESINSNSVTVSGRYANGVGFPVSVEPETSYRLSCKYGDTNGRLLYSFFDENSTYISGSTVETQFTSQTVTTPSNAKWLVVILSVYGYSVVQTTFTDIQVEKGTISHSYIPYGTWLKETTTGKNICNLLSYNFTFRYKGSSPYYQSYKPSEIKTNSIKVTGGGGNYTEGYIDITGLKPNTQYKISYTISENTLGYNPTMNLQNSGVTSSTGSITIGMSLGNTGTAVSGDKYVVYSNIQLEESSIVTDYEAYKENVVQIDLNKENLFDSINIEQGAINALTGETYSATTRIRTNDFISVSASKIYTINWEEDLLAYIFYYKEDGTFLSNGGSWKIKGSSITIPTNASLMKLAWKDSIDDSKTITPSYITNDNVSIYESNNPTPYYELCKIGDTYDELDIVNGTLTKRIGKVILNGSESWTAEKMNVSYCYGIKLENAKANTSSASVTGAKCDYYIEYTPNVLYASSDKSGFSISTGSYLRLTKGETTSDLTSFKSWLANNPVTVYYILATPEIIQLDKYALTMFQNYNHITVEDDILPTFKFEYNYPYTYTGTEAIQNNIIETASSTKFQFEKVNNEITQLNKDNEDLYNNGVSKVKTTTGYTFDEEGLKIEKSNSPISSKLDNDSLEIYENTGSSSNELLFAGVDESNNPVVRTQNLTATKYLIAGTYSRFENFVDENGNNATGIFFME